MNNRDELIRELSANLETVRPAPAPELPALVWLLASSAFVVALTHLWGPIRPNALQQLGTQPRFFIETTWGLVAIACTAIVAFRAGVPGALDSRFARFSAAMMTVWLASYVIGLYSPALEPSMLGKRPHCMWETMVYALPPMLAGFVVMRRLHPLRPVQTAMAIGLVSGMIPALYMQIACMYVPAHILQFHVLPGMFIPLVGAVIAWLLLKRER